MAGNDIAIVGMGCVIPGAIGAEQLWENVKGGQSYFSDMPKELWDFDHYHSDDVKDPNKSYTRVGGFMPEIQFPFLEHKLPPKVLEGADRAQLVMMESARQALEDAGISPRSPILDRGVTIVGVIGVDGYAHGTTYLRRHQFSEPLRTRLREAGVEEAKIEALLAGYAAELERRGHNFDPAHSATGLIESSISNRVAQVFGVRGFNMTVDAACAGGLVSVEMGCHALMAGDADVALAGGVDLGTGPAIYVGFCRVGGLSQSGNSTPFDASADGLVIGEGGGMVVLKRLEDAIADGDRIYSVIRGMGSSSDGAGTAIYTPSQEGRAECLQNALDNSNTRPDEVQYLECHATSTVVGDANEYDAIADVFANKRGADNPLRLGSIKYQIGHLKAGAGVVGLIKVLKAMEAETYPHMPNFRELTGEAKYRGDDLFIDTEMRHWPTNAEGKRIASVTASGFGGINYNIILEQQATYEAPTGQRQVPSRDMAIVSVSCKVPGADTPEKFWANVSSGRELFHELDYEANNFQWSRERVFQERVARLEPWKFNSAKFRIFPNAVSQIGPTQLLALDLTDTLLDKQGIKRKGRKNISACIGSMHNDYFGEIYMPIVADELAAALRSCNASAGIDGDMLESALAQTRVQIIETSPPVTEHTLPGWMGNCVSGRMSKAFDLKGPNFVVDTACSSSAAALTAAMYQLMFTQTDAVISGGVNTGMVLELAYAESCIGATAQSIARPFDADSDGFLQGEGGVFFLLKRLEDAQRDDDQIVAVMRAAGGSSEADSKSMIAPTERAVRRAVSNALRQNDIEGDEIGLVDVHGSGNALADITEARSLGAELRSQGVDPESEDSDKLYLTAIKSHVGHLNGGAAAGALLSVISSLHSGHVPAIRNLDTVRREVAELADSVEPARGLAPLHPSMKHGAVSSLGLGGANYFLVVGLPDAVPAQKPVGSKPSSTHASVRSKTPAPTRPETIMAKTPAKTAPSASTPTPAGATANAQTSVDVQLGRREAAPVGGVFLASARDDASTLRSILSHVLAQSTLPESALSGDGRQRLAVSFDDADGLRSKLEGIVDHLGRGLDIGLLESRGVFCAPAERSTAKLAYCFSGQGNQYAGMARPLYMRNAVFQAAIDEIDRLAQPKLGFSIAQTLYADKEDPRHLATLNDIAGSQATIFAVEIALARTLEDMGVMPDIVIGHSFGEYAALCFAGVWSLEDGLSAVVARIEATRSVSSNSALAMMSLNSDASVRDGLLALTGGKVVLCNTNAPGRFVLGGERPAVEKVFAMAEAGGIDVTMLPIAAAFHSPFMESARAPLRRNLAALPTHAPRIPVMSTVDGYRLDEHGCSADQLADRLSRQLTTQIDFPAQVEALYAEGVRNFLEVGPKWSVTKMVAAILNDRSHRAVPCLHPKVGDEETFRRAQAWLVAEGRLAHDASETHRSHGIAADFHSYLLAEEPELLPVLDAAFSRFARQSPRRERVAKPASVAVTPVAARAPEPPRAQSPVATRDTVPAATPASTAASSTADLATWEARLVVKLVERTGYPAEMLEPDLDLEADLGIDSVQRAEIWTAVLSEHGVEQDIEPKGARTLRELAQFLAGDAAAPATVPSSQSSSQASSQASSAASPIAPAAAVVPPTPPASAPQSSATTAGADAGEWAERLTAKLVEKTGYPAEMLEPELDLEADLGIDSVQRAEIWTALLEEHGLDTEAQPQGGRTIAELAGFLAEFTRGDAPSDTSPGVEAAAAPADDTVPQPTSTRADRPVATGGSALWADRLRAKLVEKTGYPEEMLEANLDLEADLGIDSVQRSEIWAALLEENGVSADVQPKGGRTIAELADFLAQALEQEQEKVDAGPPAVQAQSEASAAQTNGAPFPVEDISEDSDRIALFSLTNTPADGNDTESRETHGVLVIEGQSGSSTGLERALATAPGGQKKKYAELKLDELAALDPEQLAAKLEGFDTIVYLAHESFVRSSFGADKRGSFDAKAATRALHTATDELFAATRRLLPQLESGNVRRLLVPVTSDGAFGGHGRAGGLPFGGFSTGFFRALQRELDACEVQVVDAPTEAWSHAIVEALGVRERFVELGYSAKRDKKADLPALIPVPRAERKFPVDEGDMVFVTGGARGITFECALGLATSSGCQLALTGRTPPVEGSPSWLSATPETIDGAIRQLEIDLVKGRNLKMRAAKREAATARSQWEIHRNLARAEQAGVQARYVQCDVTDPESLQRALTLVAASAPIRGVIHGAGIQKSLRIAELDDAHVRATLDTKMVPVMTMLEALDWREMRMFVGFGSVAGLFGNAGQTHYALANDLMAHFIRHLNDTHPQLQAQTVHWTAWKGTGMVTRAQAERFEAGGLTLLGVEAGVGLFLDAVGSCPDSPELAVFNASSELAEAMAVLPAQRRWRLVSPPNGVPTRRVHLSLRRDRYLHQHLVGGNPVVPGTFIAEMMAEICGQSTVELLGVTFRRPLWVRDENLEVEIIEDEGRMAVLPVNRREMPKAALTNLEYANCRLGDGTGPSRRAMAPLDPAVIERLRAGTGSASASPEFYKILDERFQSTLQTGDIFRGVGQMTEDDGRFYGLVRLTDDALRDFELTGGFRFHPVLADMAVQVAAARGVLQKGVLAIPHGVERLLVNSDPVGREAIVMCAPRHDRLDRDDGSTHDVVIYGLDGTPILTMEGLTLKTLGA